MANGERDELHDARSLIQRLRMERERLNDPRQALVHAAGTLFRPFKWRARRIAVRIFRALFRRNRPDYSGDFRAYTAHRPQVAAADRPRVLHAIGNFRTGGSARLVVDLVEGLGSEYEQRVLVREDPPVKGYEGIPIDIRPDLSSSRPIQRLFARFRPDVVHVHYLADYKRTDSDDDYRWYIHVFDAAERAGVKVIENVNIPTAPYRSDAVERYVFVSDYVSRRFARDGDPVSVVYPGSDLDFFRPPADGERPQNTIGLVYRLEPDKLNEASFDPLIEVLRRRPDARALIVGGGQLLPMYERKAAEAGVQDRVTFTGYVAYDDLPGWYAQMNVFVAPVHSESFGHVSVLAMGMQLPIAGYDVGALGEILGEPGLLAPPGDSRALADILSGLLDDPGRISELGAANRRRAEERFSVEAMVDAYRSLYADCLRSSTRASSSANRDGGS
jgi:glycosyltransferase involved in cell wall biosynthesis